jgi:hypothetical protein
VAALNGRAIGTWVAAATCMTSTIKPRTTHGLTQLGGLACLLVITSACGASQGEQVRDARMERAEERAEAQDDAADRRAERREEAADQRFDATEERVEASDQPGAEQTKELVEISKERKDYQLDAQARLDKLSTRINTAQQKIQVLGAQAPLKLRTELQTAGKQYDSLKEDVEELDETPPELWESATKQLEERESGLEERVSQLEDSIDDE